MLARALAAAAIVLTLPALAAAGGARPGELAIVRVATGFADPVHVAAPRSEQRRIYVVERQGKIAGMLSVHASSGAVWYHGWHGRFVAMAE